MILLPEQKKNTHEIPDRLHRIPLLLCYRCRGDYSKRILPHSTSVRCLYTSHQYFCRGPLFHRYKLHRRERLIFASRGKCEASNPTPTKAPLHTRKPTRHKWYFTFPHPLPLLSICHQTDLTREAKNKKGDYERCHPPVIVLQYNKKKNPKGSSSKSRPCLP